MFKLFAHRHVDWQSQSMIAIVPGCETEVFEDSRSAFVDNFAVLWINEFRL